MENLQCEKQLVGDNALQMNGYPRTIYIILPSDLLNAQMRWVRVLMGVFLVDEKKQQESSNLPSLFMIDEFGQLGGSIDAITKGFPILRGFGIKLWLFVQSIPQLKDAFGDRWADIISGSTVQVFGVNDPETADWVSNRLGVRINPTKEKKNWRSRPRVVSERVDSLLTPDEVEDILGKGNNLQIVFPTQGRPMRLERLTYKPLPGFNPVPFDMEGFFEDW
ncbi:MAG: type IV secretory system conjugative DNA transfer family protein [Crocinitomicaceae bacterium]